MRLLNVDTIEEARRKLLEASERKQPETEQVAFFEALGRVLAEEVKAEEDVPGFIKSTVDGYAVRAADTQGATDSIPAFLDIVETVEMGTAPVRTLKPGQAAYVPTGGMIPEGADAVVMVEFCEKFDENSIAVYDSVSPGRNVIARGEDLTAGAAIMERGRLIRPQEIGVLASAGVTHVKVFKPWSITVISTGDELIGTDEVLEEGKTRDINTFSVAAMAAANGFHVVGTHVIKDERERLLEAVKEAAAKSDMVIVSGGSSQGEKDHTASVMDEVSSGGVFTHGIALKPGKPTILAYDDNTETILVGLPGHPAAALMVFRLLAVWLYRYRMGQKKTDVGTIARITENVASAGGRATCLPVALGEKADGIYTAEPILGKSGLMTTLSKADGYIMIDMNHEGLEKGQLVDVVLF